MNGGTLRDVRGKNVVVPPTRIRPDSLRRPLAFPTS